MVGTVNFAGPNALLRCLRGSTDPVAPGGPRKLDIAISAWADNTVVVPHKAAILRDWLLEICINGEKSSAESPLLQSEYLDLLLSVCSALDMGLNPRLLCRFFEVLATSPTSTSLTSHAVWTLEPDQFGSLADIWLETWASMVAVLSQSEAATSFSPLLLHLVEERVERYIHEGTASKKVLTALLSAMPLLARAIALGAPLRPETTGSILFPLAAHKTGHSLQAVLAALPGSNSSIAIAHHILRSYHSAIYRQRFDIFVQPVSSHVPHGSYINEKLRAATRKAFGELQTWASSVPRQTLDARVAYWESKVECWKAVLEWNGYLETDTEWNRMLAHDAGLAKVALRELADPRIIQVSLAVLNVLEELDHVATALDTETLAWCIKAPSEFSASALALLTSSLLYHQLSQTEAIWVSDTLDAVQSLLSSAHDRQAADAVHQSISSGPMWSQELRQRLVSIRQTRPVQELLVQRTNSLSAADPHSVVTLSVISHYTTTIGLHDHDSREEIMTAMQRTIDQLATTSSASTSGSVDSLYAVGLSALIRVGRTISPAIREQLGQAYGLLDWSSKCRQDELRREIVFWLLSRLTDDPVTSGPILDHLIQAIRLSSESNILSDTLTTTDLAVIHELSTPAQLEALTGCLLADRTGPGWTTGSAGISDLSNINTSLVDASLTLFSQNRTVDAGANLLSSLPISTFDRAIRSRIVDTLIETDNNGTAAVRSTVRSVLALLPPSDLGKLPDDYLSRLEIALSSRDVSQTPTTSLIQSIVRARFESDTDLPFASLAGQVVVAEVAMEQDFGHLTTTQRSALERLAKDVLSAVSSATPLETRVVIARLALWCGVSDVNGIANMWPDRGGAPGSARCEMLRLMCVTDLDRVEYFEYLLRQGSSLSKDVLDREIQILSKQRDAYAALLAVCLKSVQATATRETAYHALAIILGTRIEGSGKAIVGASHLLLRALFRPTPGKSSSESQTRAVHALVKYRAKLLRVSDVARILDGSTCISSLDTVGVIYTLTMLRGELLVDVIPQLVGFLCRQLTHITVELVAPLSRLLSALGQHRRHRQSARHNLIVNALGKHAPAVVAAYVRGWADPRSEIPIIQRRVLQASIYSWCDIIVRASHRGREGEGEGQPFGLGEAGAVESELWAELWTQWGRQRYRGQG